MRILAGDLLGFPDGFETVETAQEADRGRVLATLRRLSQPVFYIMGSDDWVELHGELSHQRSLHGTRVDLGGWNFVGYQFTLPFMGGVNERPESAIASDLASLESLVDSRTVWWSAVHRVSTCTDTSIVSLDAWADTSTWRPETRGVQC